MYQFGLYKAYDAKKSFSEKSGRTHYLYLKPFGKPQWFFNLFSIGIPIVCPGLNEEIK